MTDTPKAPMSEERIEEIEAYAKSSTLSRNDLLKELLAALRASEAKLEVAVSALKDIRDHWAKTNCEKDMQGQASDALANIAEGKS